MLSSTGADSPALACANERLLRFLTLNGIHPGLVLLSLALSVILISHGTEGMRGDDDRCSPLHKYFVSRCCSWYLVERQKSSMNGSCRRIEDVTSTQRSRGKYLDGKENSISCESIRAALDYILD
jgi:hypothetical protein